MGQGPRLDVEERLVGEGQGPQPPVVDAAQAGGDVHVGAGVVQRADQFGELVGVEGAHGDHDARRLPGGQHPSGVGGPAAPQVADVVGDGLVAVAEDARPTQVALGLHPMTGEVRSECKFARVIHPRQLREEGYFS